MKNNRGFTLIEMLIVIAIIAILAGIVLVGVSGFQASARDSRRIADVRNTQNLLELYYTQHGEYPTTDTWGELTTELKVSTGPTPQPQIANDYDYDSSDGLSYLMTAVLERPNKAAEDNATMLGTTPPYDVCSAQRYCVTSL